MAHAIAGVAALLQNLQVPIGDIQNVTLPSPPALVGPLAENIHLTKAEKFAVGKVKGPESMVVVDDYIYTGMSNGIVVEITPKGVVNTLFPRNSYICANEASVCGRPLGMRVNNRRNLIVANAYNGIYEIDPRTGRYQVLIDTKNRIVNSKPVKFINDVAITKDGRALYFTSSSSKYGRSDYLKIIIEGETTGRLLRLDSSGVRELVSDLGFPNGVQLGPDETFVLVAEGSRCRILRLWLETAPPDKRGTLDVFAQNLPGFVDNVRLSPRGTYWVALSRGRHADLPSILDTYGDQPHVRAIIMQMTNEEIMAQASKYGIVVELDADGNIIRSLQDPNGTIFHSVSEVEEENGMLYIGSFDQPYVGKLPLSVLSPQESTTTTAPADPTFTTALSRLLETVRKTMEQLSLQTIKDAVIKLVRQLVFAKIDAKKLEETHKTVKSELQGLRDLIGLPSPAEVAMVQSTWQEFLQTPDLTREYTKIFQRMFQMAPATMLTFPYVNSTDLDALLANSELQKVMAKMMSEVNATLFMLEQPQAVITLIRSHGARHASYGATRQCEEAMLNAILHVVESKLSVSSFNQSERNAWRSVLDMLGRNFRQGLEAEMTVFPTPQQMELVKTSWTDLVAGAGAIQDITYLFDNLFQKEPGIASLFSFIESGKSDADNLLLNTVMQTHVKKFKEAMTSVVDALPNMDAAGQIIKDIGARHANYGVKQMYIVPMSNAIVYALDLSLSARGKFSQATREAWTVFLGAVTRKFTEGLRQGPVG